MCVHADNGACVCVCVKIMAYVHTHINGVYV